LAHSEPREFWDRLLDAIAKAGVRGLELTFPPGDWRTAAEAYGGTQGFLDELDARGLSVATGFFPDVTFYKGDPLDAAAADEFLSAADEFAQFVAQSGSDIMVAGVPMRQDRHAKPPFFVDHAYAVRLADLFNRLGAVTRDHGVTLALHTGVNSVLANSRDVDLLMTLTDAEYVNLCPDAGHLVLAGADPVKVVQRHADRVVVAHWKDGIGPTPTNMAIDENVFAVQRQYFRRVGAGIIDWHSWARAVARLPHQRWIVLEIDAVPDPIEQITQAREYIETNLSTALYGPAPASRL
jgi:sugar phosphate isomerase/epimerase